MKIRYMIKRNSDKQLLEWFVNVTDAIESLESHPHLKDNVFIEVEYIIGLSD